MTLYKKVELEEGVLVQYVGVYVLHWQKEWGKPEIGFVEVENEENAQSSATPDGNKEGP